MKGPYDVSPEDLARGEEEARKTWALNSKMNEDLKNKEGFDWLSWVHNDPAIGE